MRSGNKSITKKSHSSNYNNIPLQSVQIQSGLNQIGSSKSSSSTKLLSSRQTSLINPGQSTKNKNIGIIKSNELDSSKQKKKYESKTKRIVCLSKRTNFKFSSKGMTNFFNIPNQKPKLNPSIDSFISYDKLKASSENIRFFIKRKNNIYKRIKRLNSAHIQEMVNSSLPHLTEAKNIPKSIPITKFTLPSISRSSISGTTPDSSFDKFSLLNKELDCSNQKQKESIKHESNTKRHFYLPVQNKFTRCKIEKDDKEVDLKKSKSLQKENSYVKKLASFWEDKLQVRLPYKSGKDIWNLNIINKTVDNENKVQSRNNGNSINSSKFKFGEIMFTVNRLQQLLENLPIAYEENQTEENLTNPNVISRDKTKINFLKTTCKCINHLDSLQLCLNLDDLYGRHFVAEDIDEISARLAEIIKKVSEASGIDIIHLCEETFKLLNDTIKENNLLKELNKRDNIIKEDLKKTIPCNKLFMIILITIIIVIIIYYIMFTVFYTGNKLINKGLL